MELSFIKYQVAKTISQLGSNALTAAMDSAGTTPAGALVVYYNIIAGGTPDPISGAITGGVETPVSGTLAAIGIEEAASSRLRTFQEVQAGDLIVDILDPALVVMYPGQVVSGTISLSSITTQGVRFGWAGKQYVQKEVGEDLLAAWNTSVQGVKLTGTLLLRSST